MAGLGDLNKDGFADYAIGDPKGCYFQGPGEVWVYSGEDGSVLYHLLGTASDDGFGSAIVAVGDVNDDGTSDLAVGVPGTALGDVPYVGSVLIFSGANAALLVQIPGEVDDSGDGGLFGLAVTGVSDIDDDGRPDVAIGAPYFDSPGLSLRGAVYVVSGVSGAVRMRHLGSTASGMLGSSIAGMGDLNGDGRGDIVVVVPGTQGLGTALALTGDTGAILYQIDDPANTPGIEASVAMTPDLDSDGVADLVLGVPRGGPLFAGIVTLYSGATGDSLTRFEGPTTHASGFGAAVTAGGDLDGDGVGDFAIGAPHGGSFPVPFTGVVTAYSGMSRTAVFMPSGTVREERFGAAVSVMGDLNGDGRSELLVGAHNYAGPRSVVPYGRVIVFGIVDLQSTRAFTRDGGPVRVGGEQPVCIQLEPSSGSYDLENLRLNSLVMRPANSGYHELAALTSASGEIADTDGSGFPDMKVCFARQSVRELSEGLEAGVHDIPVTIEGNLTTGARAIAAHVLSIEVPGRNVAWVAPNPLRSGGVLTFRTSTPGRVTVDLFQITGAHVRRLVDDSNAPSGVHNVSIDGTNKLGQKLASGVYYFMISSPDGEARGKVAIIR